MRRPCSFRAALVVTGCFLAAQLAAGGSAAAMTRDSEAAVEAVLRAEESLAETAEIARLSNLRGQESAALALSRASAALAVVLEASQKANGDSARKATAGSTDVDAASESAAEARDRAGVARDQRLVTAGVVHAQALEALEKLLEEALPLQAQAQDRRARVDALREALAKLKASAPPRGELDGAWILILSPLAETLTVHLSQEGPFVGGAFESSTGATGTVSGQVAGGHVRLERQEAPLGRVADIVGMLTSSGGLEGTWQSSRLGTGKADAGTFTGKRADTP